MTGIILLAYLVFFYAIIFVWRTFRLWKATEVNAYSLKSRDGIEGIMSLIFPLMSAAIFAVVLIYTFANAKKTTSPSFMVQLTGDIVRKFGDVYDHRRTDIHLY